MTARWLLLIAGALLSGAGLRALAQAPAVPGDPLAGVTPREFEEFRLGLEDFREIEESSEGLGPLFNGTGCASCHSVPSIGGGSPMTEMRMGGRDADGRFRELSGGTLFQLFSIPDHRCQPVIPPDATVVARRMSVPLFGAGLIEAVPDETLLGLEDPFDRDRDGVSGRAAMVRDVVSGRMRVGRFGWKAQHATLLAFSGDAYTNEMGITNDLFPVEPSNGVTLERMTECDRIKDPEDRVDPRTGKRAIDNFESFMRFLAPVERAPITTEARNGEQVFAALGCTSCHVPSLSTGANASAALNRRLIAAYSDFLLHDVGTGDGIVQGAAQPDEIRTPALWGLRFRRPLLHDGSAATPREAILRHGGEASAAIERYRTLLDPLRQALHLFLDSL
jgi:CxxC motif-containing protein (DUF1111 family)